MIYRTLMVTPNRQEEMEAVCPITERNVLIRRGTCNNILELSQALSLMGANEAMIHRPALFRYR